MAFNFELDAKVALVTGASSGLGMRAAKVLAAQGAHVILAARRADVIDALRAEIAAEGGISHPLVLDVTDLAQITDAVERIASDIGPVDILVNNAGVSRQVPFHEVDEAYYDWIFNTNVKGPYFLAQKVSAQMIEHALPGRIINIASTAAYGALPCLSVYAMSKAAIAHMTRALAMDLADTGINVNCIAPGWIPTGISPNFPNTPAGKQMIGTLPRHRPGSPEDLDAALLMLSSVTSSRLITGAVLPIDDGYSIV